MVDNFNETTLSVNHGNLFDESSYSIVPVMFKPTLGAYLT